MIHALAGRGLNLASVLAAISLAPCCPAGEAPEPGQTAPSGLDRAAILRELRDFSPAGMDRRFGPDYASCHGKAGSEKFPEVWMAPARQGPGGRVWQIGGPWTTDAGPSSE